MYFLFITFSNISSFLSVLLYFPTYCLFSFYFLSFLIFSFFFFHTSSAFCHYVLHFIHYIFFWQRSLFICSILKSTGMIFNVLFIFISIPCRFSLLFRLCTAKSLPNVIPFTTGSLSPFSHNFHCDYSKLPFYQIGLSVSVIDVFVHGKIMIIFSSID